jgi:hypothetical protein
MAFADDLLGDVSEIRINELSGKYKSPKPRSPEIEMLGDVMSGVTQRWFVAVFKVDNKTVARAIDGLKPVRISPAGVAYYAVRDVAPRLVKPEMPIEEYLATLKPEDLPEQLRESYWNVQAKSQKVRMLAGDLWRTSDVIEVIGEVFKHVKNTIQLWGDTIEEQTGALTDEQRKVLQELTDSLQGEIHKTVVEHAKKTRTRSQLKEIEDANE